MYKTPEEFLSLYGIKLTEQQKKAVEAINGPVLLLAVPGSGKTTTLVSRLGYMIYGKGIAPENILVLTYTVAATRDMSERFMKIFGGEYADRLEFRTINGVSAKIIAYYSRKIGKKPYMLESDEKRRSRRIAAIFQKITGEYPSENDLTEVMTAFTYIKNMMLTEDEIKEKAEDYDYDLEAIYKEYTAGMQKDGMMDYDDQMRYAYNILRRDRGTLEHFQDAYRYICVDEAQDTSKIQHILIALLAQKYGNLFMVGDEDQSIYGFRAAYPDALLHFEKQHAGAKVLVMEENFRSGSEIVDAADRFIQKNQMRHEKHMYAHRNNRGVVEQVKTKTRNGQYEYLMKEFKGKEGQKAVLYRNNESSLPIVDRLERAGIPYRIKNADMVFFSHKLVMDILDILNLSINPYDAETFMRIYYKMSLYLPKNEALKICYYAEKNTISVLQSALDLSNDMSSYKQEKIRSFVYGMRRMNKIKPADSIRHILTRSGYAEYMEKNQISDSKSFVLLDLAERCQNTKEFMERLDFLKERIMSYSEDKAEIILSTIHSSKGLEYDTVYMVDMAEGIMPQKTLAFNAEDNEKMEYEEERRMFYVGLTRAKNRLVLMDTGEGCPFVKEISRSGSSGTDILSGMFMKTENKHGKNTVPQEPMDVTSGNRKKYHGADTAGIYREKEEKITKEFEDYCRIFKQGTKVSHKKYGEGIVIGKENDGKIINVLFGSEEKLFRLSTCYEKKLFVICK